MFARTFHPDEANQAFTTARLLETGVYTYSPTDHHGPTLYYAAAPLQHAFGHDSLATLDGTLLRCTPLLFAVLAVVFAALALRRLTAKWIPALLGALFVATAPIFVFFATDFIQEMLLAAFLMMAFWAGSGYARPGSRLKPGSWAILFGVAAGLAFATKETCVLSFAAAAPIVAAGLLRRRPTVQHVVLALAGFLLTAILFYSSFCRDFGGVYNAFVAAPFAYLGRAAGNAASSAGASWHVHPLWWYAQLLFAPPSYAYSFLLPLLVLAATARRWFRRDSLVTAGAVYTALLFVFYSLIPYKTPWCALQIALPLLVTCALALARVASEGRAVRLLSITLALAIAAHALAADVQMCRDPDARTIPYNYAAASPQVKDLAAALDHALTTAPAGTRHFAAVALPACDTWPLPWYNRPHEAETGYWTDFAALEDLARGNLRPAAVICPAEEGHRVQPLFPHLNRTKRFEMRPHVRVRIFWSEPK